MPISDAIKSLEKKYGKNIVRRMNDSPQVDIEVIPSGLLALDKALGVGGYPRGRIIEAYGMESTGKSLLALNLVAQAQKLGEDCLYIDMEHSLSREWAALQGVDVDLLYLAQPNHGEEALDIVLEAVTSEDISVVVIDSVASLVPLAEINGDIGDAHVGLMARMMSQALRKTTALAAQTGTILFFVNQLRENIGTFGYGPKTTTPGGKALKFYSSVRLETARIGQIKGKNEEIIGHKSKIKVVKNKVAAPFVSCELDLMYATGFSNEGSLIDYGLKLGHIKQSGAWFASSEGEKLGQGRENVKQFLIDNPDYAVKLTDLILASE